MDAYEPGSTYKLLTAAAALEAQSSTGTRFPARNAIEVGGRTIHNAEDGLMGTEAAKRSNRSSPFRTTSVPRKWACAIGAKTFYAMERKAGFGDHLASGCPAKTQASCRRRSQWSGSSLATMSFGQGVSVTPLAMARYYCAIANGGMLMQPRIVRADVRPAGRAGSALPAHGREAGIFAAHGREVARLSSRGRRCTAQETRRLRFPAMRRRAKPAPLQMVVDGAYRSGYYAASFIGMVPYPRPRYVIYVKVERPRRIVLRQRCRRSRVRCNRPRRNAARRRIARAQTFDVMAGDRAIALATLLERLPGDRSQRRSVAAG